MSNSKPKPAIPEPSPRFALWGIGLGVVLIMGLVAFEYGVVGVQPAHKATATTHLAKDHKDRT